MTADARDPTPQPQRWTREQIDELKRKVKDYMAKIDASPQAVQEPRSGVYVVPGPEPLPECEHFEENPLTPHRCWCGKSESEHAPLPASPPLDLSALESALGDDGTTARREFQKLLAETRELQEECSKEYQRGRRDEQAARSIQSPTWEKDVVPLRGENRRLHDTAVANLTVIRELERQLTASRSLNKQHVADLRWLCARIRHLRGDLTRVEEIEKGLGKE